MMALPIQAISGMPSGASGSRSKIEMPAGAEVSMPANSYARIRQALWVLDGELQIREGGEVHDLRPGDCLGFGPPSDVTFANHGARPCRYVVAVSRS